MFWSDLILRIENGIQTTLDSSIRKYLFSNEVAPPMKKLILVPAFFLLFAYSSSTVAAQEVTLTEWKVPYENSRPRDPYVGPDGNVWFVGQRSDYIGVLNPEDGSFEKYDLEPGAGPHNCIVDEDGFVWYSGNTAAHIGRLDPSTGEIEKIPMPDPGARDPHTLIFDSKLALDDWYTFVYTIHYIV